MVDHGSVITFSLTHFRFFMKCPFSFEALVLTHVYDVLFQDSKVFLLLRSWISSTRRQRVHHVKLWHERHRWVIISRLRNIDRIHRRARSPCCHYIKWILHSWHAWHRWSLLLILFIVLCFHLCPNFFLLFIICINLVESTTNSTKNHVF